MKRLLGRSYLQQSQKSLLPLRSWTPLGPSLKLLLQMKKLLGLSLKLLAQNYLPQLRSCLLRLRN